MIPHNIYWFSGLPCSGKTTIAKEIVDKNNGFFSSTVLIDGDEMREIFGNVDFSWEGRKKNMFEAADLAYGLSEHHQVVVSLISPVRSVRDKIKEVYKNVVEVYIKCSLQECINRDVKGMYAKAISGEITQFTGISSPYEAPLYPDIIVDTEKETLEECMSKIMGFNR